MRPLTRGSNHPIVPGMTTPAFKRFSGDRSRTCPLEMVDRLFGDELARAFHETFRGSRLYIPIQMHSEHPIALAIGLENAKVLSESLGGVHWEIPLALPKPFDSKQDVLDMTRAGKSANAIAIKLNMSRWTVFHVRRTLRAEGLLP